MRKLRHAILFFSSLPAALHASPLIYNAANDFSLASNPNGVWSYGYGAAATPLTVSGTAYLGQAGYGYWSTGVDSFPVVGHTSNAAPTPGFTPYPPPTDLWLHPANDSQLPAQVVFTAPTADTYNISALFERVDQVDGVGNGVGVAVYLNGSPVLGRTILFGNYLDSIPYLGSLNLAAGDRLSFAVDSNGEYTYDSTGLNLTITSLDVGGPQSPVPEPSSIVLFATGAMAAAASAKRKFFL